MSLTGYRMPDGTDLSYVFVSVSNGTPATDPTGYVVFSSGLDLQNVFARNTSGTYISTDTRYKAINGLDLRYIFEAFEPFVPFAVTITGPSTNYTSSIVGNKYTYTFNTGTNTISINKNIPALYAIVCGGGGGGKTSDAIYSGGGGSGGGFGVIQLNYLANTVYNTSVAASVASNTSGNNSTFLNNSNKGVTASGGRSGAAGGSTSNALGVNCSNTLTPYVAFTPVGSGFGGSGSYTPGVDNGSNGVGSLQTVTVLGVDYRYGGGGGGGGAASTGTIRGGQAGRAGGLGGVMGSTSYSGATTAGQNGTNIGAGGGGGGKGSNNGGGGGPGIIIVTFVYQ
jgi:hypothetical protein